MSHTTIKIERAAPPPRRPAGAFLLGAAEVDITPHAGFPLAGFSAQGEVSDGVRGHLFTRVLYLRDETGEDIALCVTDMMSASRLLLELVAQRTIGPCGLGVDRIVLHGTHTHTGPSWFYGSSLYDSFAGEDAGFDSRLCEWFADRIAGAVRMAFDGARAGGIAFASANLWGLTRNRSLAAFQRNAAYESWLTSGPGRRSPPGLILDRMFVDPRLWVLVGAHAGASVPAAVFSFFSCHATALGEDARYYGADWPGAASRTARSALHDRFGNGQSLIVSVGARACGDVSGHRYGFDNHLRPGPSLQDAIGREVGRAVADAAARAVPHAAAQRLLVWFSERAVDDPPPASTEDVELAPRWYFGAPTIGGSEESPSVFRRLGLVEEGETSNDFPPTHPQHPKTRAFWFGQNILTKLLDLEAPRVHPLHVVKIGDHCVATLPGEPTIWTAFEIELALRDGLRVSDAIVLPCTGDYAGYFASRAEYDAQHYEGSSTILGRNSAAYLRARLLEMVARVPEPAPAGPVTFQTVGDRRWFSPDDHVPAGVAPAPALSQKIAGGRTLVRVSWQMPENARVVFGQGAWLRVEERVGSVWQPLLLGGRVFDDVNQDIEIARVREGLLDFDDKQTWIALLVLPSPTGHSRRIVIAPRGGFPGFALALD